MMSAKPLSDLTAKDLAQFRVWEFDLSNESSPGRDETWVVPVIDLPVKSLSNRVVVATLRFGQHQVPGLLGNIELNDVQATREFATLAVYQEGSWFHLLRYFDPGYDRGGPARLAEFLGLSYDDVFPIMYDISDLAVGHPEVVTGRIEAEPKARLTKAERMSLLFDVLGDGDST